MAVDPAAILVRQRTSISGLLFGPSRKILTIHRAPGAPIGFCMIYEMTQASGFISWIEPDSVFRFCRQIYVAPRKWNFAALLRGMRA